MADSLRDVEVELDGEPRTFKLFVNHHAAANHVADHFENPSEAWKELPACQIAETTSLSPVERYGLAIADAIRFGASHPLSLVTRYQGVRMQQPQVSETFLSLDGVVVHARDGIVRTAYRTRGRGWSRFFRALFRESQKALAGEYEDTKGGGTARRSRLRQRSAESWRPGAWSLPRWRHLQAARREAPNTVTPNAERPES